MAIERPWKSLKIKGDYPLLFLKARLNETRCTLELTDLNRLWVGSLTRTELLKSASDQGTSIDPSEDDGQFDQFLSKVNSALEGERKTSICLEPGAEQDGLELSVTAPLPGSLPTLKWTTKLRRVDNDDGSVFERDILTPLLVHANNLMSQVQYLVTELGHKDRVIGKIADKLENIGQDLGQVFPGASNPRSTKAIKRAQLASHVEGLAEFDAEKWEAVATRDIDQEDLPIDTVDSILARLPAAGLLSAHKDTTGIWWRSRGTPVLNDNAESEDEVTLATASSRRKAKKQTKDGSPSIADESKSDDFQRQHTPPKPPTDNDETEDDDDLDAPRQKASQARQVSQNGTDSSRTLSHGRASSQSQEATFDRARDDGASAKRPIGMIGGRRSARSKTPEVEPEPAEEDTPSPSPAKAIPGARKIGVFGRKTQGSPAPEQEPEPEQPQRTTPKRGKKLGTFGGNAKTPSSPPAEASQHTPGKRLGMFGGRSQNDSEAAQSGGNTGMHGSTQATKNASQAGHETEPDERQPRSQVKSEEEVEQQKREDSEERANIRREKLKRDIEEKAKGPVKKKRKF